MAKFVKLENGNYINVDMIVDIEKQNHNGTIYYEVYMREQLTEIVTHEELDNILKASESKNNSDGEKKISKETIEIAVNAIKNECADLGSQAGFALETDAPGAASYYRDCEEQNAILEEAIDELEEYGDVHFEGLGSKSENELKKRGMQ